MAGQAAGQPGFLSRACLAGSESTFRDALGYTIIYHDVINTVLKQLSADDRPAHPPRGWASRLGQIPEQVRMMIEKMLSAFSARRRCPVCEHQEEVTRTVLSVLAEELKTPEMTEALQASEGLCLPHLRLLLERIKDRAACETLLTIQRGKLEGLRTELAEFIRKNDYRVIQAGFGKEGDAWLRAAGMLAGARKKT
jgi:hypothetical protein